MKLNKEGLLVEDGSIGFIGIEELELAKQIKVDIKKLEMVIKAFKTAGFDRVVITVDTGCPIILGGEKQA